MVVEVKMVMVLMMKKKETGAVRAKETKQSKSKQMDGGAGSLRCQLQEVSSHFV